MAGAPRRLSPNRPPPGIPRHPLANAGEGKSPAGHAVGLAPFLPPVITLEDERRAAPTGGIARRIRHEDDALLQRTDRRVPERLGP